MIPIATIDVYTLQVYAAYENQWWKGLIVINDKYKIYSNYNSFTRDYAEAEALDMAEDLGLPRKITKRT